MRRHARWLFTLCSAVSLLLCVASCVLWVRSHTYSDVLVVDSGRLIFASQSGRVYVYRSLSFPLIDTSEVLFSSAPAGRVTQPEPSRSFAGIGNIDTLSPMPLKGVVVHDAIVLISTAFMPLMWLLPRVRRRRLAGACPACGYDLRASPDRCPECGAAAGAR